MPALFLAYAAALAKLEHWESKRATARCKVKEDNGFGVPNAQRGTAIVCPYIGAVFCLRIKDEL